MFLKRNDVYTKYRHYYVIYINYISKIFANVKLTPFYLPNMDSTLFVSQVVLHYKTTEGYVFWHEIDKKWREILNEHKKTKRRKKKTKK